MTCALASGECARIPIALTGGPGVPRRRGYSGDDSGPAQKVGKNPPDGPNPLRVVVRRSRVGADRWCRLGCGHGHLPGVRAVADPAGLGDGRLPNRRLRVRGCDVAAKRGAIRAGKAGQARRLTAPSSRSAGASYSRYTDNCCGFVYKNVGTDAITTHFTTQRSTVSERGGKR